jgi:tetratricopeptide (TPR) repeat protein
MFKVALNIALLALLQSPAADPPAPYVPRVAAAVAFERGAAAYNEGAYSAAIIAFTEAYRLYPGVKVLFNLALAYDRDGQQRPALQTYRKFERELPHAPPEEVATLGSRVASVRARIKALEAALGEPAEEAPAASPEDTKTPPAPITDEPSAEPPRVTGQAAAATPSLVRPHAQPVLTPPPARPIAGLDAPAQKSGWSRWWWVAAGLVAAAAATTAVIVARGSDCPGRGELGCVRGPD